MDKLPYIEHRKLVRTAQNGRCFPMCIALALSGAQFLPQPAPYRQLLGTIGWNTYRPLETDGCVELLSCRVVVVVVVAVAVVVVDDDDVVVVFVLLPVLVLAAFVVVVVVVGCCCCRCRYCCCFCC